LAIIFSLTLAFIIFFCTVGLLKFLKGVFSEWKEIFNEIKNKIKEISFKKLSKIPARASYTAPKSPKKSKHEVYKKYFFQRHKRKFLILTISILSALSLFYWSNPYGHDIRYDYRTDISLSSEISLNDVDISDLYSDGFSSIYVSFEKRENGKNEVSLSITFKKNSELNPNEIEKLIKNSKLYYFKENSSKKTYIKGKIEEENGIESKKKFDISEISTNYFYIEIGLGKNFLPTKSILLTESNEFVLRRRIEFFNSETSKSSPTYTAEVWAKYSHMIEISRSYIHGDGTASEKENISHTFNYKVDGEISEIFYNLIFTPNYSYISFILALIALAISLGFNSYWIYKRG